MNTFKITVRDADRTQFTLNATDYTDAANKAAKRINLGNGARGVVGVRVTGEPSMSGIFQGFRDSDGGKSSIGPQFNLAEQ